MTNQEEHGQRDENRDRESDLMVRQVEHEGCENGDEKAGNDEIAREEERLTPLKRIVNGSLMVVLDPRGDLHHSLQFSQMLSL